MTAPEKVRALIAAMEENFPQIDATSRAADLRARYAEIGAAIIPAAPEPVAHVEDRSAAGSGGAIPVRIYRPLGAGSDTALPLLMFFHGGGFVLCGLDSHDALCRALCNASNTVVVAVDYRLAPEHPFPAGVEDCYAALLWAVERAAGLGADPDRVAVFGDSAGGNLAAAAAQLARDRGGPRLAHQVLVYPMLDPRADSASHRDVGGDYYLRSAEVQWFWGQYAGADDLRNPYAAPPFAADLGGLPPALVITAEHDPLRDEGEAYAQALRAAGVPTTLHRYDGMFHSFLSFLTELDEAPAAVAEIAAALQASLGAAAREAAST